MTSDRDGDGRKAPSGAARDARTESADGSAAAAEPGIPPRGFRLPPSTHPGPVTLRIANLDGSLEFYENVLGARVLVRDEGRAVLGPFGSDAPLIELREMRGAAPAPRQGRLGLFHFAVLLPDRASLGRLLGHLTTVDERVGSADHLVSEALYLHDPDGLGIEVYADRPREEWRYDGRELRMDTMPLDVAGLIRSGRGQPWTGMPGAARMGHVHLHVGDLGEAATFYRDALGLDTSVWSYPGALFLSAGGYHHHLGVNTWAGAGAIPPRPNEAGLLEWQLVVPDVTSRDAAAENVRLAGYEAATSDRGWTTSDPWGTRLRIVSEAEV